MPIQLNKVSTTGGHLASTRLASQKKKRTKATEPTSAPPGAMKSKKTQEQQPPQYPPGDMRRYTSKLPIRTMAAVCCGMPLLWLGMVFAQTAPGALAAAAAMVISFTLWPAWPELRNYFSADMQPPPQHEKKAA